MIPAIPLIFAAAVFAANGVTGVIEGALGYPGEEIPGDMKVCAENLVTKQQYCTAAHIENKRYRYGLGYRIEVPEGRYHVFATTASLRGHRAYYSEFVTCGLRVGCSSHAPIVVTVVAGQTVSSVDPHDWYK